MKIKEIIYNKELNNRGFLIIPFNEGQFKKTFSCRMYKITNIYNLSFEEYFLKEDLKKWAIKELKKEVLK